MIKIKTSTLILLMLFAQQVNAEKYVPYDTKSHPKAIGTQIKIIHPAFWVPEESKAPHTVQKFVKLYPNHKATMMIQVIQVPKEQVGQMSRMSMESFVTTLKNFGEVGIYKKVTVSNLNGFMGDVVMYDRSGAINSVQKIRIVNILFQDKWIGFWCGVTASENTKLDELAKKFSTIEPDCNRFIESVTFN